MNIKEFNNIMSTDDIQSAHESYQDMLDANESVIESFENLLKEYENTETRINENYYNSDIKEAVNEKADKVKKCTNKIVDKLKNQRDYLKKKIHSKTKKSKKEYAKLEEFKDKAKDVDFNESTITLKRYNSGRQTESFISTMESTITKMNKLAESYYNTDDKRYLDKFDKTHNEYKELFKEACEYLNTTSEVRLDSALVESAINTLISENSNVLELRKEYDNLMGKLQTKARYNGKVLESFSDANAAQMSVYPAMIDTYQFKISKLNSDVANAKKIIEAAAQFDENLYEEYLDLIDNDDETIEEGQNIDLMIKFREEKKKYKKHVKAAKAYIRSDNISSAKKEIEKARSSVQNIEKELKKFDRDNVPSNILGFLAGSLVGMCKTMLLLLPTNLLAGSLAKNAVVGLLTGDSAGTTVNKLKGSVALNVIPGAIVGLKDIYNFCNRIYSNIQQQHELGGKGLDSSIINTIYNDCIIALNKMDRQLDKMSKNLSNSKNESASWLNLN